MSAAIEATAIERVLGDMQSASALSPAPMAVAGNESFATTLAQATNDLSSGDGSASGGGGLFVGLLDAGANPEASSTSSVGVFSWPTGPSVSQLGGASTGSRSPRIATAPLGAPLGGSGGLSGRDVVNTAAQFQGTPYVWGGTSPSGFDCSGFVQYVYARLGVNLPRTSEQQALVGTPVASLAQAQAGDLLFFAGSDGTANAPGHVAIYVGNGQMIDAPYTGTTVQVQPVSSAGPIVAIRRVLGPGA
jgi:peptidoglycan DL-endopeptidase CwlO